MLVVRKFKAFPASPRGFELHFVIFAPYASIGFVRVLVLCWNWDFNFFFSFFYSCSTYGGNGYTCYLRNTNVSKAPYVLSTTFISYCCSA